MRIRLASSFATFASAIVVSAQPSPTIPIETATDGGVRIWQMPAARQGGFTIAALVGVGFRHERRGETGLAHLVEHCLFGSTQRRSASDWRERLRDLEAHENGVTTPDYTAYHVKVEPSAWREVVEWLGEAITQPKFVPNEVDRQRQIVLEELDLQHDSISPDSLLYPDSPLGRSLWGDSATVEDARLPEIKAFHRRYYRAGNIVVAFSTPPTGPPAEDVVAAIQTALKPLAAGPHTETREPMLFVGEQRLDHGLDRSNRRGYLLAGYHILEQTPDAMAALLVLEHLLGESFNTEVRERRGLAYAPSVSTHFLEHAWRLDFEVRVSEQENLATIDEVIEDLILRLAEPNGAAFARAKNNALAPLAPQTGRQLVELTHLVWLATPRERSAVAPDLGAALQRLQPDDLAAFAARNLVSENRFDLVSAPATGRFSGSWTALPLLLMLAALIDGLCGFPLWNGLRRKFASRRRHRPPQPQRDASPPIRMQPNGVNKLEQEIQQFLDQEDKVD